MNGLGKPSQATGVPYAQLISSPEGLGSLIPQPPPNLGFWEENLSVVDQLTNTIPINSYNLGTIGFIDAN
jgi:hypothetical protein